ncbi:MAG: chorismate synthase [Kiritimatiellae bacterium]|nr:chorismate synthase [Kiritimatiellia bacterium]
MSNTLGSSFRVTTFGESHAPAIGAVIDGCPAGLPLAEADIQHQLDRRRPGQSPLTTSRNEADQVRILSGLSNGLTLGTPLALLIQNTDQRPNDYKEMIDAPRPSHADFTWQEKFGIRAPSGGGRASARETAARVAAGTVAELLLKRLHGADIVAWVDSVGSIEAPAIPMESITRADVDAQLVRCPDPETARRMEALILETKEARDSIGGTITCVCRHLPIGLGQPVFDKATARLAQAMLSIPSVKGFEYGTGFAATRMKGSEHNDTFAARKEGGIAPASNRSGGLQGGITNGQTVYFRVAFKPTATIGQTQQSVDFQGRPVTIEGKGRHDPCVLPRAVPIVEAMAALVFADLSLLNRSSIL